MYIVYLKKYIIEVQEHITNAMYKVSITLKCHHFEVVTHEILDFKGHKYEEVDYPSQLGVLCPLVHN